MSNVSATREVVLVYGLQLLEQDGNAVRYLKGTPSLSEGDKSI
jgi:hypothetical protein